MLGTAVGGVIGGALAKEVESDVAGLPGLSELVAGVPNGLLGDAAYGLWRTRAGLAIIERVVVVVLNTAARMA
jgi:hypothetical protein